MVQVAMRYITSQIKAGNLYLISNLVNAWGLGKHRLDFKTAEQVVKAQFELVPPDFVIARKSKKYGWKVADKLFDYKGNFRKANQLSR